MEIPLTNSKVRLSWFVSLFNNAKQVELKSKSGSSSLAQLRSMDVLKAK